MFELIRTLMIVLIAYKNEEDPIKNESPRVWTTFSPLLVNSRTYVMDIWFFQYTRGYQKVRALML